MHGKRVVETRQWAVGGRDRDRARAFKKSARALPQIVRDAFFFTNGKLGVAAQVFVKGARPWV